MACWNFEVVHPSIILFQTKRPILQANYDRKKTQNSTDRKHKKTQQRQATKVLVTLVFQNRKFRMPLLTRAVCGAASWSKSSYCSGNWWLAGNESLVTRVNYGQVIVDALRRHLAFRRVPAKFTLRYVALEDQQNQWFCESAAPVLKVLKTGCQNDFTYCTALGPTSYILITINNN